MGQHDQLLGLDLLFQFTHHLSLIDCDWKQACFVNKDAPNFLQWHLAEMEGKLRVTTCCSLI